MLLLRNAYLEQMNMAIERTYKPSLDSERHWLNPLLNKCRKRL